MPGLEDLYREIILDHYRAPRNRGELPVPPAHKVEGFNPLCGDEVILYLDVDVDDGTVSDIRTDLNIGNVPFLVGELLFNSAGGCCGDSLNPLINSLPNQIPNTFVVSANGLANIDNFHFDLPGQRTFGARYGEIMLDALGL